MALAAAEKESRAPDKCGRVSLEEVKEAILAECRTPGARNAREVLRAVKRGLVQRYNVVLSAEVAMLRSAVDNPHKGGSGTARHTLEEAQNAWQQLPYEVTQLMSAALRGLEEEGRLEVSRGPGHRPVWLALPAHGS